MAAYNCLGRGMTETLCYRKELLGKKEGMGKAGNEGFLKVILGCIVHINYSNIFWLRVQYVQY
jgi:hypothetical protein